MRYLAIFSSLVLFLILVSCNKQEGEGGTATIRGIVWVKLVSDNFDSTYAEFPDEERDVYIIYGDDDFTGDNVDTQYDGSYQFGYLRKGNYKVYAYSDDISGQSVSGKVPIMKEVTINKNGEIVEAPIIEIYDQVTTYEGSSTIQGKLFAYDWNSELNILKDSFYVKNEYVYLSRKGDSYYFERIRTFWDGSFVFPSLPIGHYEVFAYSRDSTQQDPQDEVPIIISTSITSNRQVQDVGRLDIID